MSQEIIRRDTGEVMDLGTFQSGAWLDPYAEGGVSQEEPRLDALATVSAGYRKPSEGGHAGLPQVSRDGKLYLHDPKGRAPGLKKALEARGSLGLTIAFPFNNPDGFVQQRFTEYSSTNLLAHGDASAITVIDPKTGTRKVWRACEHPEEYEAAKKRCKLTLSIYFTLAEWGEDGPRVIFPDGLGLYRIRTTSRNTQRNLRAALESVATWTHGQIAGVPFDTSLDYRDVAGPDGSRRNVPVFVFVPRPPGGLNSRVFVPRLQAAIREGQMLQLPPPSAETIETAEWDYRVLADDEAVTIEQPIEAEVEAVALGGTCDARYWESQWFVSVKGTRFDNDEARAIFLSNYTHGTTESLSEFLGGATEAEASDLLAALDEEIQASKVDGMRASAMRARDLDGDDDPAWKAAQAREAARRAALEAAGMDTVQESAAQQVVLTDAEYREIDAQETSEPEIEMFDDVEAPPSPEPAPPPKETPGEKSKRRRDMEHRLAQLLSAGTRLGLDLAPYAFDDATTDGALEAKGVKLAAAIKAQTAEPAKT